MGSKKGFELTMSFLVSLILSLVIFSYGVYFIYELYNNTPEPPELELPICRDNDRVCLTKDTIDIGNEEIETTKLYLLNTKDNTETFKIEFIKNKWVDNEQNIHDEEFNVRILADQSDITLLTNERKELTIAFEENNNLEKGVYIVDLIIYQSDGTQYDRIHKIYLTV